MKKSVCLILPLLLTAMIPLASSCEEEYSTISLMTSSTIYTHGEQTIEVNFGYTSGYTFESGISASDVTIDGLDGKSVTNVSYVSDSSINVTISGNVTAAVEDIDITSGIIGTLHVNGGISGHTIGNLSLRALVPVMETGGTSYGTISGLVNCSSTYILPYGSFVEEYCTAEYVTLPTDNGTISVSLNDSGNLHVSVSGFDTESAGYSYPAIRIAPEVTTFEKELYVYVGVTMLRGGYACTLV